MISVPMPSPGRIAIFIGSTLRRRWRASVDRCASQGCVSSRSASKARILSAWRSVRPMSSRPFEQAVLAERLDVEARTLAPSGVDHDLALEVDRQAIARRTRRPRRTAGRPACSRQHDRQQAVLEAVVEEDVGVASARSARESRTACERPRRVLARRAAAEVLAREQDRRALVARLVQHEVRVRPARRGSCPARRGRGSATRRTGSGRSPCA